MQIGNPLIRNYDQNIQAGSRAEQSRAAEQSGQVKNQADISSLSEGSVFRGEITDISGEKVTIATDNKGQIMARLQADMELGVGDQLLFSVKENNTSQILIKPLFDSLYSAQTQVLEKALDSTGLSPTEKNFSAAKELMEAGMPLDKGNMVKLLSQSMKFEGTSMHTLVALNKMNIPVTAENIAQYERYQNYSHQLSGDISQTADSMADFVSSLPPDMDGGELLSVAKELVNIFNPDNGVQNAESEIMTEQSAVNGEAAADAEMTAEAETTVNAENGENITNENAGQGSMSIVQESVSADKQISHETKQITVNSGNEAVNTMTAEGSDIESGEINAATPVLNESQMDSLSEKTGLTKNEINNLTGMLKDAGVSNEQIKDMLNNPADTQALLKDMVEQVQTANKNDQAVRNLLSSNEFKKMFSDMVKKEFALNPSEMKDPKEIDQLYNKIIKQTEAFENTIAAKGGDTGSFQQNSQNMHQNMQFMQELNNQMIYAQMPLKLSNQNANSELFVYADKRKLAGKRDDISVMLHLDMDHLGTTDIKVTLTGTNVNARFYLNDQESVNIIADNMGDLAKQLTERGFSLTNEVVMRNPKESPNKVVDEIVDSNAEKSIKRFTFDART